MRQAIGALHQATGRRSSERHAKGGRNGQVVGVKAEPPDIARPRSGERSSVSTRVHDQSRQRANTQAKAETDRVKRRWPEEDW